MAFLGVYGHVNVDYILQVPEIPRADHTVPVQHEAVRLGGTGGNLARAAASLGLPTALSAAVGTDFPAPLRAQLESGDLDLSDLVTVEGPTPKIWILHSHDGAQAAIIEQGVMGDDVTRPRRERASQSDWVHFTTGPPAEHLAVAEEASRQGRHIAFDPAQELTYRYEGRIFERFLNASELFFVNQVEMKRALAKLGYGVPEQLLDHVDAVIETRGAQGCVLYSENDRIEVPAFPVKLPPRGDTVGAGDVFRAGVYAGIREGARLAEAARWGAAAASLYLEAGANTYPTRDALRARLRGSS